MGIFVLVDDEELERKTFLTICADRKFFEPECFLGLPSPEALVALIKAERIAPENILVIFLDLQLKKDDRDRGGLDGADYLRQFVGDVPIIAYTRHSEVHEFADISSHDFDGILLKQDFVDPVRFGPDRFHKLVKGWRGKRGLEAGSVGHELGVSSVIIPSILHLSDLQFGRAYLSPRELADSIVGALGARRPNIVVVSGDLAQTGDPSEYVIALEFLERLCGALGIVGEDRNRVIICPGNHDVNWVLSVGLFYDEKGARRSVGLSDAGVARYRMAPFYDCCASFYGSRGGVGLLSSEGGVSVHDLRSYGLIGVSINSSFFENQEERVGRLSAKCFEQLEAALDALGDLGDAVVFAVFHHPIQVGASAGYAVNASDLIEDPTGVARRLWRLGIRIVFTGHIHASSLENIVVEAGVKKRGRGLINLLAGAVGVPEDDRPTTLSGGGHFANEFGVMRAVSLPDEWEFEAFYFDAASRAFLPKVKFPGPSSRKRISLLKSVEKVTSD